MSWRLLFGLVLLVVGIGAVLEQLQLFPANTMNTLAMQWWPMLLVLIGLNQLIRRSEGPWVSMIIVGIGIALFSFSMDRQPNSFFLFFYAVLIILFGLQLLLPRRVQRTEHFTVSPKNGAKKKPAVKHQLNEYIIFGGLHYQDSSRQFQGGKIYAIFGDYILDLNEAILHAGGAQLEMLAIFGNITIRVPETMAFTLSGTPALGSLENTTRQIVANEPGRPKLVLHGTAICSTIAVKNPAGATERAEA